MDFKTNASGLLPSPIKFVAGLTMGILAVAGLTLVYTTGRIAVPGPTEPQAVESSYDEKLGVACYWLRNSSKLTCIQVTNGTLDEAEEAKELLPGPEGIKYVF